MNWIYEMFKSVSGNSCIQWWTGVIIISKLLITSIYILFLKKTDRLISILISTRESQEGVIFTIWHCLFLWTIIEFNKEKRHLIGHQDFLKENINAAMADIWQQIFHKRHNHKFIPCEISKISTTVSRISWHSVHNYSSLYTPE